MEQSFLKVEGRSRIIEGIRPSLLYTMYWGF